MASETHKILTAQCHCKAVHFTLSIPVASLPLRVKLCHCAACRHTHGTPCIFNANVPRGIEPQFIPPSSISSLKGYKFPHAVGERLFCTTCGCHMGDRDIEFDPNPDNPEWRVATSIFDSHGDDVFQIARHIRTNDAGGGGIYEWLPAIGGRAMAVWNPEPGRPGFPTAGKNKLPEQEFDEAGNERLRAQCHCGGVSFTIPRPTIPEVTADDYFKTWVSPTEPHKWIGCVDVCDDCRLMDGTHVITWTFAPLALIQPHIPKDLKYGTLTTYTSSEGVLRAFCGVCGATVFIKSDSRAPTEEKQVVNISTGILRAREGVLAQDWLTWRTGRLAWHASGSKYDPLFTKALAESLDEWGKKTYGESLGFSIG